MKAVIVGGGSIDPDWASGLFYENGASERSCAEKELVIAADRGLLFLDSIGIVPDLVTGDLDSLPEGFADCWQKAHPDAVVERFPPEKDYTDTELAALAAAERGCEEIELIGVSTGRRLDHTFGVIETLALLREKGLKASILDKYNRITLHTEPFSIQRARQWGRYVSFFAWGGEVTGLTLKGFRYPLAGYTLTGIGCRAVSNEIAEETAHVNFSSGRLLMMETCD